MYFSVISLRLEICMYVCICPLWRNKWFIFIITIIIYLCVKREWFLKFRWIRQTEIITIDFSWNYTSHQPFMRKKVLELWNNPTKTMILHYRFSLLFSTDFPVYDSSFILQKRAVGAISSATFPDHRSPLFKLTNKPKCEDTYEMTCCIIASTNKFKYLRTNIPHNTRNSRNLHARFRKFVVT